MLDRVKEAKRREKVVEQKKEDAEDTRPDSELTADELAARQLIKGRFLIIGLLRLI